MRVLLAPAYGPGQNLADEGRLAIVIDALRASVTITAALALGAREVIPVAKVDEAQAYLGRPGYLVAGERSCAAIEDFHFGNSPLELIANRQRLAGQSLVLTTSNGTQAIESLAGAAAVLIGSLPNLSAVASQAFSLAEEQGLDVALVPAGWLGEAAEEDLYAAAALGRRLAELGADWRPEADLAGLLDEAPEEAFILSPSGERLKGLGYADDVRFCARLDTYSIAPRLDEGRLVAL